MEENDALTRVSRILAEIEAEAVRLVEGARGGSALSIVSRAASARRMLDDLLGQEPQPAPVSASVAGDYIRRIRLGVSELKLSPTAAANLAGLTEEEITSVMRGSADHVPFDVLERAAARLEAEQQLPLEALVQSGVGGGENRPSTGSTASAPQRISPAAGSEASGKRGG